MLYITLILGAMYAGKSSELHRILKRYKLSNKSVILLKHCFDARYGTDNNNYTHDKTKFPCITTNNIGDSMDNILLSDIIGIDEIQFFDLNEIKKLISTLRKKDKAYKLILSGLQGDFNQNIFNNISYLIPLSNNIIHLTAICEYDNCGEEAHLTHKKIVDNNSDNNSDKKIIDIGGKDKYIVSCGNH